MGKYLVVAYETANSPELRAALARRAEGTLSTSFVLLVPATPTHHLLLQRKGEAIALAEAMAQSARSQLEAAGVRVENAVVGHPSPIEAIAEALQADASIESLILCTHPADVSRWLRSNLLESARQFGLPVTHIVVRSVFDSVERR